MTQQQLFDPRDMTPTERDAFMETLSTVQKNASAISIRERAWHSMASIWNDNEEIRSELISMANTHWINTEWNDDFYECCYGQQLHIVGTLTNLLRHASNVLKQHEQSHLQQNTGQDSPAE